MDAGKDTTKEAPKDATMEAAMVKRLSVASNLADKLPEGTKPALKKAVEITVQKGWDQVNWKEGLTGLHLAAQLGDKTVIKVLLACKADVSLEAKDAKSKTPYDYAWERKERDMDLLLLLTRTQEQAPAELYEKANKARLPQAWTEIFDQLRKTETILVRPDDQEYSLLHYAARYGGEEAVKTLVNEFNADASELTGDQYHEDAAAVAKRFEHDAVADFLRESLFAQILFTDAEGRSIRIKFTQASTLDLFIDGKHRVRRLQNLKIDGDTLTFDGQRIMFNEDGVKSEELKNKELSARILEMVSQTRPVPQKKKSVDAREMLLQYRALGE